MVDASRVRTLTEQALDNFDNPGTSVAALVRQAQRIAVLRHDYGAQAWLALEAGDLLVGSDVRRSELMELKNKIHTLLGADKGEDEYIRQTQRYFFNRTNSDGKMQGASVEQLETTLDIIQNSYDDLTVPDNLTQIDTYYYSQTVRKDRSEVRPIIKEMKDLLSRIKQSIYDYLIQVEKELETGKVESSFFDQVQARINEALNKYAPDAVENFIAAQERVSSGGSEGISHALTSCRRMIKSLADSLYPASKDKIAGLDGVKRSMTDDMYKNRLLQYVVEKVGKHKDGQVLQSTVTELGSRLDALDGLASKGVHAKATLDEAHTCIFQTYLLAGSLLAIADGTSYLMQDDEKSAPV
ncbi:hypothetical protein ACSVIA_14155 [Rhodococcus erythropolis]|uniref:hypothetical protein n=1 Tax=Rhodococcus erythropolis TaxID=1833 RepID=UPI00404361A3